jgi:hypothetical protein
MTRWTGAAILAAMLILGGSAAVDSATATSLQGAAQQPQASDATDLSARRRVRPYPRYASRPYVQPHYYDRPDYYRPYPYALPVPFFLGFGFDRGW